MAFFVLTDTEKREYMTVTSHLLKKGACFVGRQAGGIYYPGTDKLLGKYGVLTPVYNLYFDNLLDRVNRDRDQYVRISRHFILSGWYFYRQRCLGS